MFPFLPEVKEDKEREWQEIVKWMREKDWESAKITRKY
jgi:hypothetical protein